MKPWAGLVGCLVVGVCALGRAGGARAQSSDDKAAAEALFQDGMKSMDAGRFVDACPKFEASLRLDPAVGTMYNLGDCYEKSGKIASAWAMFKQAGDVADRAGDPGRAAKAHEREKALEPRVPKIQIVPGDTPGIIVMRDGTKVEVATLGIPVPIDPGSHELHCTAPGRKDWKQTIVVGEGATVVISVPALATDTSMAGGKPAGGGEKGGPAVLAFIVGDHDEKFEIEVQTAGGLAKCDKTLTFQEQCKVTVPSGTAVVSVHGAATFTQAVEVEGPTTLVAVQHIDKTLTYVGLGVAGGGLLFAGVGVAECLNGPAFGNNLNSAGVVCAAGAGLGGAMLIGGVVLAIYDQSSSHHRLAVVDKPDEEQADTRMHVVALPTAQGGWIGLTRRF